MAVLYQSMWISKAIHSSLRHVRAEYKDNRMCHIPIKILEYHVYNSKLKLPKWKLKKKTLWPLFMDGIQLPQG